MRLSCPEAQCCVCQEAFTLDLNDVALDITASVQIMCNCA